MIQADSMSFMKTTGPYFNTLRREGRDYISRSEQDSLVVATILPRSGTKPLFEPFEQTQPDEFFVWCRANKSKLQDGSIKHVTLTRIPALYARFVRELVRQAQASGVKAA